LAPHPQASKDKMQEKAGFDVYHTPQLPADFQILGDDCQILNIALKPGQEVLAEPGAMCYAADKVKAHTGTGGLGSAFARSMAGESIFKVTWKNDDDREGFVGFTAPIPASIIPLNMTEFPQGILCKPDAFLCSVSLDTRVSIDIQRARSCLACCFSGMAMVMQKVIGGSWGFLAAHGTILQKRLGAGEVVVVDTVAVVALEPTVEVDVRCVGGCTNCCCMGEGMFNTTLTGPGLIILSSMPIEKLRRHFARPPPRKKKDDTAAAAAGN